MQRRDGRQGGLVRRLKHVPAERSRRSGRLGLGNGPGAGSRQVRFQASMSLDIDTLKPRAAAIFLTTHSHRTSMGAEMGRKPGLRVGDEPDSPPQSWGTGGFRARPG